MKFISTILALGLATTAAAQDRDGNDTPGEWRVTHHTSFGLWDSFCDERQTGDLLEERCYVRYVDVFSPRPNFGAIFFFVTPTGVEFGLERGMRFEDDGFRVDRDGVTVWQETRRPCLRGRTCTLENEAADAFLEIVAQGGEMRFAFEDPDGNDQDLTWSLQQMREILEDYRTEATKRGLL